MITTSRIMLGAALLLLPGAASAQSASTQNAPPRLMHAARRTGEITLDGHLDEPAWKAAVPSGDFTQAYPAPGKMAPDRTEIRVLYDDKALYVGIRMIDPHPDSIAAGLARRDAAAATGIYSDWVHLIIDSYHDRRTAFRFSTTPRGVQKDVYTYNDGTEDVNWDAVWEVGTSVDAEGWTAEYRIPLSQLRFGGDSSGARVWGFQVQRDIARRNERDTWAPWTPTDAAFVSHFGDLDGLGDIRAAQRIELTPYVSSTLTRAPGDTQDPFYSLNDAKPHVGGDVKYGLPGGLTLSATVNPDFGQVEVDPAVVNLSAFETSFPEKRPFFLEGSDVFSFGQVVLQNDYGGQTYLYSRRIGRQPQLGLPAGTLFSDVPAQATIATAGKITGKAGPWTVGLLDALTLEQNAEVQNLAGARSKALVEPLTNYFAARLKRDMREGQSSVGTLAEFTKRDVSDPATSLALRSSAAVGGVDFEHNFGNRQWTLSGFALGSQVDGSHQAIAATQRAPGHYFQRPDAGTLGLTYDTTLTSMRGYIAEGALSKRGLLLGSVAVKVSSPGLELNDLGQQNRTGYKALSTLIGRQSYTANDLFSNWAAFVYENDVVNYGDKLIFRGWAGQANATFKNLWSGNVSLGTSPNQYDDQLTRGGPEGYQPTSWYVSGGVTSDSRRPVVIGASGNYTHDILGGFFKSARVSADFRPSSNVHVNFGPSFNKLYDTEQYVRQVGDVTATQTAGRRYIMAHLNQTTLSLDTRVDVTISPTLSFVMYAQPFVSTGNYDTFKEFLHAGTYDYAVYGVDRGTIAYNSGTSSYAIDPDGSGPAPVFAVSQPNFNVRSLHGDAVMRWDYRPGSSLFFVWQQERSDFEPIGEFETRRDVGAIFRTVPTNVFLVKATYWISR